MKVHNFQALVDNSYNYHNDCAKSSKNGKSNNTREMENMNGSVYSKSTQRGRILKGYRLIT